MTGQDTDSREDHVDCRQAQWARELPDLDTEPMAILGRAYRLSNLVRPSIEATFAAWRAARRRRSPCPRSRAGRHALLCYSTATLERHYRVFAKAFAGLDALVCYAMKANSNQAVLKTLAGSARAPTWCPGGELRRALAAGIPPEDHVLRRRQDRRRDGFRARGRHPLLQRRVRARAERAERVAVAAGKTAPVSLRINPDVDAKTHAKISTGKKENKFGIPGSAPARSMPRRRKAAGHQGVGIDMHIGSQITDLQPFDDAFALLANWSTTLRADGHTIEHVDVGGGLGIPYHHDDNAPPPLPDAYAEIVKKHVIALGCKVVLEPGRLIVGNAGILVTEVIYVKEGAPRPSSSSMRR
jgi:diaminopimelate decarboxylase